MEMEGDLTWSGEHTIKHTDDILHTLNLLILLTKVTPIKLFF